MHSRYQKGLGGLGRAQISRIVMRASAYSTPTSKKAADSADKATISHVSPCKVLLVSK
jgi:hypothetical protein